MNLICLLILLMSILFIGKRNRHFTNQPHFWMDRNEQQTIINHKKITQQQYRMDLLQQIKQKQQKKKKQKQREIQNDMQREHILNEHYAHYHSKFRSQNQIDVNQQKSIKTNIDINPFILKPNHKQATSNLPEIQFQFNPNKYKLKHSINTEKGTYESNYPRPNLLKMKTEHLYQSDKDFDDNTYFLKSTQIRHKEMKQQLNSKISEVYSLMAQSAKTLNQSQQLSKIGKKLSPIKLSFQPKYKIKYPQQYNPEQNQNFYRLPKIGKHFKQDSGLKDSEANWREWYSKQKLRQLQNLQCNLTKNDLKYRNILNGSNIPSFQSNIN